MTPSRLEEIRQRLEAATPGPWRVGSLDSKAVCIDAPGGDPTLEYSRWESLAVCFGSDDLPEVGAVVARDNACLVANAPGDLAGLLDYVDELHRVIHDASQDAGASLGERRERARAVQLVDAELSRRTSGKMRRMLLRLRGQVEGAAPALLLPADELAAENDRLRRRVEELERLTAGEF